MKPTTNEDTTILKNKGLILLVFIFCFMYALNVMTPLLSDDYFISYVWPEGLRINAELPLDIKRVSSFSDVFESLKNYYFIWGGRLPGQTFMTLFAWWGKSYFNIINSFMVVMLISEIYWISHEGKITFDFDYKYILGIFFSLWSFNMVFVDIFLWLSGSCEYLWMMVLLLAFLLPYVQAFYDEIRHEFEKKIFCVGMFLGGVVTGCSREMLICWLVLVLSYWLFLCKKNGKMRTWQIFGLVGLCLGYSLLILAPGNFSRLIADDQAENIFMNPKLLAYKLVFIIVLFIFHSVLWHYIISFLIRQKKVQRNIKEYCASACKNITLAKVSLLIALGPVLFLFILKYSGARPSFTTLVFLIISAASLIRAKEKAGIQVVNDEVKLFLKTIGLMYLVITMLLSIHWNYDNWRHWNSILQYIENDNLNRTHMVLEVTPMPHPSLKSNFIIMINEYIDASAGIWCGAQIVKMTFLEDNNINRIFSRYYNIGGIKFSKEKQR